MVDYSKWDKLQLSDDEDEEEIAGPRVTRLDESSSVSWGGNKDGSINIQAAPPKPTPAAPSKNSASNSTSSVKSKKKSATASSSDATKSSLKEQYSKWDKIAADLSDDEEDGGVEAGEEDEEDAEYISDDEEEGEEESKGTSPNSSQAPRAAEDPGVDLSNPHLWRNGAKVDDRYVWNQSRSDVLVHVLVPPGTKGKDVEVQATKWTVDIKVKGDSVFSGRLAYPMQVEGETGTASSEHTTVEAELDWELKDVKEPAPCRRALLVSFPKLSPAPGVVVWWQGVLTGDPTVSIEDMPDRQTASQTVLQQNWAEAHRLFKEKMAQRKPIEVDVDDDNEADGQAAE